jgi:hypothetical protein
MEDAALTRPRVDETVLARNPMRIKVTGGADR